MTALARTHENPHLPGVILDEGVTPLSDLGQAAGADLLLAVVPAQATRDLTQRLMGLVAPGKPIVLCSKGIERDTGLFMSEVMAQTLPKNPAAVLSGPSFAADVSRGLPTAVTLAAQDEAFRFTFEQADIIHADGQAAVFASRLLTRTPIPERSATTDFIHDASKVAVQHGLRFFMLGATEEANAEAVRVLRETYPGLQIVGRRHGYFSRDEEDELCDEINLTQPDVIWVGLSVPTEYEFAVRNKTRLKAGWLVSRRQALHGPLIANAARILESAHAAPIGIVVTN